jgi:hypothetical protein
VSGNLRGTRDADGLLQLRKQPQMIGCDHVMVLPHRMLEGHVAVLHLDRRVGKDEIDDDGDGDEPFDGRLRRLTIELGAQFREPAQLEQLIRASLQELRSEE